MLRSTFAEGRALLLTLTLNGRPIALLCNVLSSSGGFSLFTTYDETYTRFGPGVLLAIHNIRAMHEIDSLYWMDSCADCGHPVLNSLWPDKRMIQQVVISDGTLGGDFLTAMLPAANLVGDLKQDRRNRKMKASGEAVSG